MKKSKKMTTKLLPPPVRVKTALQKCVARMAEKGLAPSLDRWEAVGYDEFANKIVVAASAPPPPTAAGALAMAMRDVTGYPWLVEFVVKGADEPAKPATVEDRSPYINPNVIPGLSDFEPLAALFAREKIRKAALRRLKNRLKPVRFSDIEEPLPMEVSENFCFSLAEAACHVFGVARDEFFSPRRIRRIFVARQAVALFLRTKFNLSFKKIARFLRKDHSSVIHMTRNGKSIEEFVESPKFLEFCDIANALCFEHYKR